MLDIGNSIHEDRYTLKRRVLSYPKGGPEVWEAVDSIENPLLIKTWSYQGDTPDDFYRAQWDLELRNLFR